MKLGVLFPVLLFSCSAPSPRAKPVVNREPAVIPQDLPNPDRRSLQDQAKNAEADSIYRIAVAMKSQGNLEGALREVHRALQVCPDHREARALLRDLADLLGQPGPVHADKAMELHEVRRRQSLIEIENHLGQAERLNSGGEFERALEELQRAQILISAVPDENLRGELSQSVRKRISEIKQSR